MSTDIEPLLDQLSGRSRYCLINLGVKTVEELRQTPDTELLALPNFGRLSLKEVRSHAPYSGPCQSSPWSEIERIQKKLKVAEGILCNAIRDLDKLAARFKP